MAIYRGAGGAGDAVADSSSEALLVRDLAVQAQTSADAAAASASAALSSKNDAATSATSASTSATNAATSATNAASSASSASTSASTATTKASAASTSATAAATSATSAATSATTATTQASNASSSATTASTAATNAANSATTASTQATNAAASASAASTSASNAATSATNAANSATTAASYTPSQTGNAGKYLTTNGTATSWTAVGNFTTISTSSTTSTTPVLSFNASNSSTASGATVAGSYLQHMLQNKSGTAGASTNYVLSNDLGTDSTYYGEFGMNSSVFSASTPADFFSINNGTYFSSHDGDVTVGSGNGFKSYLAWGTAGQSAHVINAAGAIGLSTNLGTTPATSGTSGFGTAGQVLTSAGSGAPPTWSTLNALPSQTGNSGKYLTTNGTAASWATVNFSPAGSTTQVQYNNAGAFGASSSFTFDGTTLAAPIQRASNGIVVNNKSIAASYSIASGDNAMSVGPVTVASGQSVTVASGSRWVIL